MSEGHRSQRKSTLQRDVVLFCTAFNQLFVMRRTHQDVRLRGNQRVLVHFKSNQTSAHNDCDLQVRT